MFKAIAAVAVLIFAGGYFAGAFGGGGYARTVGRPQAEVMAALADLDITAQPGAPGSTAAAAGGVQPAFRLETATDHMTWYVMSGDKVATAMTATFVPVDGGKGTRVTATVQRGNAPDDVVSPAFRSHGLTLGLFGMALEGEFNKLTAPPPGDPAKCQELRDRIVESNVVATAPGENPENLRQAFGQAARITMRLGAQEQQLRAAGCWQDSNPNDFVPVKSEMQPATDGPPGGAAPSTPGVTFKPGAPMVDPSAPH